MDQQTRINAKGVVLTRKPAIPRPSECEECASVLKDSLGFEFPCEHYPLTEIDNARNQRTKRILTRKQSEKRKL